MTFLTVDKNLPLCSKVADAQPINQPDITNKSSAVVAAGTTYGVVASVSSYLCSSATAFELATIGLGLCCCLGVIGSRVNLIAKLKYEENQK